SPCWVGSEWTSSGRRVGQSRSARSRKEGLRSSSKGVKVTHETCSRSSDSRRRCGSAEWGLWPVRQEPRERARPACSPACSTGSVPQCDSSGGAEQQILRACGAQEDGAPPTKATV